jgi:hypothetical protein
MATYSIPTVDQIFAAGIPVDQVNQSQLWSPNVTYTPPSSAGGLLYPYQFDGGFYNMSYLYPQWPLMPNIANVGIPFPTGPQGSR